ncbi:MAG: hypothetical protein M3N54_04745 [Acidobacteriota bacterium]|nr:hypothetical protein [Acidobacteriota bacterium]
MKRFPFVIFLAACGVAQTAGPRSVYILPMAGGFDQYLAEQISRDHVMQVVTDPKKADAVLTDRLGEAFELNIAKIHPLDGDSNSDADARPAFRSSGTRGTIFLVDTASRRVLWSDYQKMSRATTAGVLNREAQRVTKKLAMFTNPPASPRP